MSFISDIVWHHWPEEKPTYSGEFIVLELGKTRARGAYYSASKKKRRFSGLRICVNQQQFAILWNVEYWAEMPRFGNEIA